MSLLQEIVVFLCGFHLYVRLCAAQVVLPGACPKVQAMTDFDPGKYLGIWYEAEKYFFIFELGGTCVVAEYSDLGGGRIGVKNSNFNTIKGRYTEIQGEATQADPSVAKLAVRFPTVPGNFAAPYWVVDTDYSSYALVWSCNDFGFIHFATSWILTRDRNPSPTVMQKVYESADNNKIDKTYFMKTEQNNCSENKFNDNLKNSVY